MNFNQIIKDLESKGKKFTDPRFPPEIPSYCDSETAEEVYEDIEWYRATKMSHFSDCEGKTVMEPSSAKPQDIIKYMGKNGFLISCLQVLAENPKNIESMFLTQKLNKQGVYAIRLYKHGKPQTVVIDDFIPTSEEFPFLTEAPLWVHLIEKAWAKIHGCYEKSFTNEDQRYSIYSDLTGAKIQCLTPNDNHFTMVEAATKCDHVVAIKPNYNFGLPTSCEYAIQETIKIRKGKFNQLCKIRLPVWVKGFTWTGDWSKHSEQWNPEAISVIKEDQIDTPGFFWMSWPDIVKNFSQLTICEIDHKAGAAQLEAEKPIYYECSSNIRTPIFHPEKKSKTQLNYNMCQIYSFDVESPGQYMFSVYQESSDRVNLAVDEKQDIFGKIKEDFGTKLNLTQFSDVRLYITHVPEGIDPDYEYVNGCFTNMQKTSKQEFVIRNEGKHLLILEVDWKKNTVDKSVTLCGQGPQKIDFNQLENNKFSLTKEAILRSSMKSLLYQKQFNAQSYRYHDEFNVVRSHVNLEIGYSFYFYENESKKTSYHERLSFPTEKGQKLCYPESGDFINIDLYPMQSKIILFRQSYSAKEDSLDLGYNSILGDDDNIHQCQSVGKVTYRDEDKSISVRDQEFRSGHVLTYKNRSETINFQEVLNLEHYKKNKIKRGGGFDEKLTFELRPGRNMVVKFVDIGNQSCILTSKTFSSEYKVHLQLQLLSNRINMSMFIKEQDKILKKKHSKIKKKDGSVYWGPLKHNVKDGFGKLLKEDGEVYFGNFKEDLMNGKGNLLLANGDTYDGNFKDSLYNGKGCLYTRATGEIYIGEFVCEMKYGKGQYFMKNNSTYLGNFKNDMFDGKGQLKFPDNDSYDGDFKEGLYHGEGIYTFKSGKMKKGEFENGKLVKWIEDIENEKFNRRIRMNKISELDESSLQALIENIWDKFDVDKNGELDRVETKAFLKQTMEDLMFDDRSGKEFHISENEYMKVFNNFDVDMSGTIDKQEMVGFIKNFF